MTLPGDVLKNPVVVKVKAVGPGPQDNGAHFHAERELVRYTDPEALPETPHYK